MAVDNTIRLALRYATIARQKRKRTAPMREMFSRGLFAATAACGLTMANPAFAGGAGMPWEGPLQQIVESVTGPVVQAAAVVAVVIFGAGIAMSESGSGMRRGLGILF